MKCPRCEEGTLSKIRFLSDKKIAYLCDYCRNFWYENEHIDNLTSHSLDENAKSKEIPEEFEYLDEKDNDQQKIIDKENRELYKK